MYVYIMKPYTCFLNMFINNKQQNAIVYTNKRRLISFYIEIEEMYKCIYNINI